MSSNIIVIKERDEWSSLAEFIGNMIAKYAEEIDFDSLPDPDLYLMKNEIYQCYKKFSIVRKRINKINIEFRIVA